MKALMVSLSLTVVLLLSAPSNVDAQKRTPTKPVPKQARTKPTRTSSPTPQDSAKPKEPSGGDPISGEWDGTAQFSNLPPVQIELKLKLNGKTVVGELKGPPVLPISDGIWADNKLILNFPKSVMTGTIKGSRLVGEFMNQSGERGTWEARRRASEPNATGKTLPTALPELLNLIQNELDSSATAKDKEELGSQTTRKIVQPGFSGCSLVYTDTRLIKTPFFAGSTGSDVSLSLTDLDSGAIQVVAAETGYDGQQLELRTIDKGQKIKKGGKPMVMGNQVVGSGKEIYVDSVLIPFKDSETANWAAKAFSQAIKLCRKPN